MSLSKIIDSFQVPIRVCDVPAFNQGELVKIAEGSYGEIYVAEYPGKQLHTIKIYPIGGNNCKTGNHLTLKHAIPEFDSTISLSKLKHGNCFKAPTFPHNYDILFCEGRLPENVVTAWNEYFKRYSSYHPRPDVYCPNQKFAIIDNEYSGCNLNNWKTKDYLAYVSIMAQITCGLAAAESCFEFEHRDLHCGNVLIHKHDSPTVKFIINRAEIEFPSRGIKTTLIDYGFSRIKSGNKVSYCSLNGVINNLLNMRKKSVQDLLATLNVYRQMDEVAQKKWHLHHPFTNVLWLKHILETFVQRLNKSKVSKKSIPYQTLWGWSQDILNYPSATAFAKHAIGTGEQLSI